MEAAGQGHLRPGVPVRAAWRRTCRPTVEYSITVYGFMVSCRSHVLCSVAACSGNIYISTRVLSNLYMRGTAHFLTSGVSLRRRSCSRTPRARPPCCIACSSWWSRSSRPRRRRRTRAWVRTTPRRTVRGHQPAPHGPWLPPDVPFARAADGECCAQGNYKKEGHGCAAALLPAYV